MLYKVPMRAVQGEKGLGYKAEHSRELEWNSIPRNLAAPGCTSTPRPTQDGEEQHKLHSILVELEAHRFGVEDGADEVPLGCAEPCGTGRRSPWHRSQGLRFNLGFILDYPPHPHLCG